MWDELPYLSCLQNYYATHNWIDNEIDLEMRNRIKARMAEFEKFVVSLAVEFVFRVQQIWRERPVRPSQSVVLFQPRWSCKRWKSKT